MVECSFVLLFLPWILFLLFAQPVQLDEKIGLADTDALCKKVQSDCTFSKGWHPSTSRRSCTDLLPVSSSECSPVCVACWGRKGSLRKKDPARLENWWGKQALLWAPSLTAWFQQASVHHWQSFNTHRQKSSFNDRLLLVSCSTDSLRKSFWPHSHMSLSHLAFSLVRVWALDSLRTNKLHQRTHWSVCANCLMHYLMRFTITLHNLSVYKRYVI